MFARRGSRPSAPEHIRQRGIPHHLARLSSAFCLYFMDHTPKDFHDLAGCHDFALDRKLRALMIQNGVY
jgi:glutamate-1-semialdehyde 2,1-aminomutase